MSSAIAPAVAPAALNANVQPCAALLGVWSGAGVGTYPTIKDFAYEEELTFSNAAGKPFVAYSQRTWVAHSQRQKAMHEENGFLRFVGGAKVEAMVTQCTGVQEVLAGEWAKSDDSASIVITLDSTGLTRTPSAKQPHVTQVQRVYTVAADGSSLTYKIAMATDKTPELHTHLEGKHAKQA